MKNNRVSLSVNINKIATIRNARGGNVPDVLLAAQRIESFGAQGITVHPRPDERHITYSDVYNLSKIVTTEFNVEGYPSPDFLKMVEDVKPHQVTLVPDPPGVLTSNAGWDTLTHASFLKDVIAQLKAGGMRTSVFVDTDLKMIDGAVEIGADRIELYTESYAVNFHNDKAAAVQPFSLAAAHGAGLGLKINAGHDLDLANLKFFAASIPELVEVSIGHALISDALYYGLENTVQMYLRQLHEA
ncbi:MAG: pyridoxine 5'-phosphate synthase [Cryomorphaceae bacterium]|nr:pyridoxine 5'-phosphate synthase [Cryomorphaceae bacterium]